MNGIKRRKTKNPYSDPYTYGSNPFFEENTTGMDQLSGFRTAQDYANENIPGIYERDRKTTEQNKNWSGSWSPGMTKAAIVVGGIIAIALLIASGCLNWIFAGISNLASWIFVALMMTVLTWVISICIGRRWIYGRTIKYLFVGLFIINLCSVFIPGLEHLGFCVGALIIVGLLIMRMF